MVGIMIYNRITLPDGITLALTVTEWGEFLYLYNKAVEVKEIDGFKQLLLSIDRNTYDWGRPINGD